MSDEIKPPRILRENETFRYVVDRRAPREGQPGPTVWLFGGQRNVIPGGDDEAPEHAVTVQLAGGTVTITIKADLFDLTPDDRAFVSKLVALVQEFEDQPPDDDGGEGA